MKISFEFQNSNSNEMEIESLWAIPVENGYQLDNIPFYVKNIALGDIVSVREMDGELYFDEIVSFSHHSTIRIWFLDESKIGDVRNQLISLGCSSEMSEQRKLIAVDIPPSIEYNKIKEILDEGEKEDLWEYQEACLGFL